MLPQPDPIGRQMPRTLPMKANSMVGARHALPLLLLLIAGLAWSRQPSEPPAWVASGAQALPDSGTTALYGIGRAEPNITNVPFSKVTAKERARVNLAFAIQAEVRALLPVPAPQSLIRPAVEAALPRCRIAGVYLAPDHGRYALARLPYSELVRALRAAVADPKLVPPDQAAELQGRLERNLQARGFPGR